MHVLQALAKRLVARRERYGPPTHTDGAAWAAEAEGEAATWVLSLCLQQETPVTHMRLAEGALAGVRYVQLCCAVRPRQERDVPVAEAAVEAWWADHDAAHASILSALPDLYALELKFVGTTSEPAVRVTRPLRVHSPVSLPRATATAILAADQSHCNVVATCIYTWVGRGGVWPRTCTHRDGTACAHARCACYRHGS